MSQTYVLQNITCSVEGIRLWQWIFVSPQNRGGSPAWASMVEIREKDFASALYQNVQKNNHGTRISPFNALKRMAYCKNKCAIPLPPQRSSRDSDFARHESPLIGLCSRLFISRSLMESWNGFYSCIYSYLIGNGGRGATNGVFEMKITWPEDEDCPDKNGASSITGSPCYSDPTPTAASSKKLRDHETAFMLLHPSRKSYC